MLDWLIEEYPGDRFVLELVERIFVCYGRKAKQGGTLNGVLSKAEFGSLNFVVDVDIGIASALV